MTLLAFAALSAAPVLRAADPAPGGLLDAASNDPASLRARQEQDAAFRLLAAPAARREAAAPAADPQSAAPAGFASAFPDAAVLPFASGSNLAGLSAQPQAILVPPAYETSYYSRGRTVATSGGTALVASAPNTSVLGSTIYLYRNVDTATGSVTQSAQLASADGQAGGPGDNFGSSMSLVGGLGLVGAPSFTASTGYTPKVYVYNNLLTASGTVTESAQLRPSDSTNPNNQVWREREPLGHHGPGRRSPRF